MLKYQISWKSVQWERNCSMWPDRPTDMTKLIIALFFVILRDALKNCTYDFAQVTARSNFTRRSAHSDLYARSTKAQRAVSRKTSCQYSRRSGRLVATLNARPQAVKQPQVVFYIQQVYSFSIGSTPGVRMDAISLIVQPLLPLSSDTSSSRRLRLVTSQYLPNTLNRLSDVTHIDFCSSVPPRVLTGLPTESFTGKKRVCDAGRSPAMQSIVTPVWVSSWVEIWTAGRFCLTVIAKQDGVSVTSQF